MVSINKHNIGRIAERIVSNELESRGYRVSDLNKEGTSANSDLLAAKNGNTWQIQVKGASEGGFGWWFNYGFGKQEFIDKNKAVYNSVDSFYRAQVVVLVCVRGASDYKCIVLPVEEAERAAQLCLDHSFRMPKKDGSKKKPGKFFVSLGYIAKVRNVSRIPLLEAEQEIIKKYADNWNIEPVAVFAKG